MTAPSALGRGLAWAQRGFVVWVLLGALWGYAWPGPAAQGKQWIPEALAAIMLGMGLTLTPKDLADVRVAGPALLAGVGLQYMIMPLSAWMVAKALGLTSALALGMIIVGACPGGTASNVVVFLARGDVALSVGMTALSTLLSPLFTPLWIWMLASTWLSIDPLPLFWTVTKVVLLPVLLGMAIRRLWHPAPWVVEGVLPLGAIMIIAWIVGVIVAANRNHLEVAGGILFGVALHNALGLGLGYLGAGMMPTTERQRRAISIEVGMQNSGLAVALAVAHFDPLVAVPGALFSVWHNVTGPLLASLWRERPK
ncbi:MAG: bile acid:sodium symporter family protein [Nitrospirae bacterium]|nr:MAG: bile acid:sodium symporter family protein [Nitrospirota bacterium]